MKFDETLAREDRILNEVQLERRRQDKKWGVQNHPSVCNAEHGWERCYIHYLPSETQAQEVYTIHAERGTLTWAHIAVEELAEAVSAPGDATRREELIQLAAVIVAWVEKIDRDSEQLAQEITDGL